MSVTGGNVVYDHRFATPRGTPRSSLDSSSIGDLDGRGGGFRRPTTQAGSQGSRVNSARSLGRVSYDYGAHTPRSSVARSTASGPTVRGPGDADEAIPALCRRTPTHELETVPSLASSAPPYRTRHGAPPLPGPVRGRSRTSGTWQLSPHRRAASDRAAASRTLSGSLPRPGNDGRPVPRRLVASDRGPAGGSGDPGLPADHVGPDAVYAHAYGGRVRREAEELLSLARHGRVEELADRLDEGVFPPDLRDAHGNTMLHVAGQNGLKRVAKALLRRGADINAVNHKGNTAAHYCFQFGFADLGHYLISKGLSPDILNASGQTCFEGAR